MLHLHSEAKTRRASSNTSSSSRPRLRPAFKVFPDLPLELRLQIWEAALPPPQIIPVMYMRNAEHQYLIGQSGALCPFLLACRESRSAALSSRPAHFQHRARWESAVGGDADSTALKPFCERPLRAHLSADTLYLASSPTVVDASIHNFIEAVPAADRGSIQHLAVDERIYNPVLDQQPRFELLHNLQDLTVVQHEDCCRRDFVEDMRAPVARELCFQRSVVESVEEAMWKWVDECGRDQADPGLGGRHFPRLRLVRLLVDGKRCCEGLGDDEEDWRQEFDEISDELEDEYSGV